MTLYGVQKEKLHVTKKEYLALRQLCWISKNMYNVALYNVRQHFFHTKTYLNYEENYKTAKCNENYKIMGSAAAQQTMKKVDEAFQSFFSLLKTEGQKPRIPQYLEKDGFFELSYPQFKMQADGTFNLPMSPSFKREFGLVNITFPTNLDSKDISEIRIIPKYHATYFEIEYVYKLEPAKPKLDKKQALVMDLGVNNFASCLTTLGTSFIIDGKKLKSVNQWYNKENARLQSIKDLQGIKVLTNRQVHLVEKRNNFVRDYLNKATRTIINTCLDQKIGKIIVGHNQGWKKNIHIGKKNNQTFVQIPHSLFIKKMESMCERYGILFEKQEESYTSKASFLDNDVLPVFDEGEKKKYSFSGKRKYRGLYQSKNGINVHADLHGAANILRKSSHPFSFEQVARALTIFPVKIDLFHPKVSINTHL